MHVDVFMYVDVFMHTQKNHLPDLSFNGRILQYHCAQI